MDVLFPSGHYRKCRPPLFLGSLLLTSCKLDIVPCSFCSSVLYVQLHTSYLMLFVFVITCCKFLFFC